jgi:DNA replication protein DnaT
LELAFNQTEQTALIQPISNDARILYVLGLRPYANSVDGVTPALNYKQLLNLLNAKEEKFTLGRQINSLIKELLSVGLINFYQEVELSHSFNGKKLILPLMLIKPDDYAKLHLQWHTMSLNWCPNEKLLEDLAKLVGIIDWEYSDNELGDFIAYWLGRPEVNFSQFQWTQKFVFNLKQKRLARGVKTVHKVGNQIVTTKAAILADENAKNLVAKYSAKSKVKDK